MASHSKAPRQRTSSNQCAPSIEPAAVSPHFWSRQVTFIPMREGNHMNTMEGVSSAQLLKKTDPEEFDLVILGGGTGSTIAAWTFAGEGQRVALIDRKYIGGSCPNIACLPSKNIIHSAKVVDYFRRSKEFGISHDGFTLEMSGVRDRKRKMVSAINDVYLDNYRNTGAEFILGTGRFVAARTVDVAFPDGTIRQLRGAHVI